MNKAKEIDKKEAQAERGTAIQQHPLINRVADHLVTILNLELCTIPSQLTAYHRTVSSVVTRRREKTGRKEG